jgi:hypothetical protein
LARTAELETREEDQGGEAVRLVERVAERVELMEYIVARGEALLRAR